MPHRQYHNDILKFLQYAMTKPDVWGVTMQQLLDWMQTPVPASGMAAFMSAYPCVR